MIPAIQLLLLLLAVNGAAFIAFWWDKQLARAGAWRISESTLLGLAILGGSPGAICAQHLFRHKTRKEPFRSTLYGIVAAQVLGGAVWLLAPQWISALFERMAG